MEKTNRISVFRRNTNKLKVEGLVLSFPIKKRKGCFLIIMKESMGKKRKSRFFLCEDEKLKEYDYENKQASGNLQRQQRLT